MQSPLVRILDCGDLPHWETELLETLAGALGDRISFERRRVSSNASFRAALQGAGTVWVWTRRWRERAATCGDVRGPVYIPVFDPTAGAPRLSAPLGFRSTQLPPNVRLVSLGKLSHRFLEELERVPANQLVRGALPVPTVNPSPPASREGRAPTLGTLAPFLPESNLPFFLVVAHAVAAQLPEARFLIGGAGPLENHLRRMCGELGLADRVVLATDDEALVVRRCDAFLFAPVRCDHLGPLLFAAASARPTLLADTMEEEASARDGREALLFPLNEAKPASELAMRVLTDRSLAQGLGSGLRRLMDEKFSAGHVSDLWHSFFTAGSGARRSEAAVA